MLSVIKIGSRRSNLALAQASLVAQQLTHVVPGLQTKIVPIQTKGDQLSDVPLQDIGGKGLFLKEIEEALIRGEIDIAVHSVKDIPAFVPEELVFAAILERGDARDVLISASGKPLDKLDSGSVIGTCSSRRRVLLRRARGDLKVVDMRGNVCTRIEKMQRGDVDALILAAAALDRLKINELVSEYLDSGHFIPAVGQGAVGVECRKTDSQMFKLLKKINHKDTQMLIDAERAFLITVEGDCKTPLAFYARKVTQRGVKNDREMIKMSGFLALNNKFWERKDIICSPSECSHISRRLAKDALRFVNS